MGRHDDLGGRGGVLWAEGGKVVVVGGDDGGAT